MYDLNYYSENIVCRGHGISICVCKEKLHKLFVPPYFIVFNNEDIEKADKSIRLKFKSNESVKVNCPLGKQWWEMKPNEILELKKLLRDINEYSEYSNWDTICFIWYKVYKTINYKMKITEWKSDPHYIDKASAYAFWDFIISNNLDIPIVWDTTDYRKENKI